MCNVTKGRKKACKTNVGGVKRIFWAAWEDLQSEVVYDADGVITAMGTFSVYQYDLPNNGASFDEPIKANLDNGTVYYEPTVSFNLFNFRNVDRNEIMLMARGNHAMFLQDYQGVIKLAGSDGGMEVNGGSVKSGKAKADMNGATIDLIGSERELAFFLEAYTAIPFDNFPNVTVVQEA